MAEEHTKLSPAEIAKLCEKIFALPVEKVTAPGGKSRESLRVHFTGKTIVATQRRYRGRMRLEIEVLKRLSAYGAPVPKFLGGTDQLFFQEDVGSRRLTSEMVLQNHDRRMDTAAAAFESLLKIRAAAEASGLAEVVPSLGEHEGWVRGLIGSAFTAADRFSVPRPAIDLDALAARLTVPPTRFVKWDARPGNGSIGADGQVYWFDWEHCGRRQGMEDFAWLTGDEFWPLGPEDVVPMLTGMLPKDSAAAEMDYLADFITFHIVQRLMLIYNRFMADGWVDTVQAMRYDKIGVDAQLARDLCRRGAGWAERSPLTRPMVAWFGLCETAVDGLKQPAKP